MSLKYDFNKLKEAILFNTVEVLPSNTDQLDTEIKTLIEESEKSGQPIRHYIGFEISGQIHIGTGIMSGLKIKALQDAGVKCSVWLADYHTWLNEKLDGKIETIRKVSKEYFGPVLIQSFKLAGCDIEKIDVLSANEMYENKVNGQSFWTFDMKIAKSLTLSRVLKSVSVTGKEAGENVAFGTLRYPVMQVADAFFMQTHLVHAGIDQRKCHVLMREVAGKLDDDFTLKIGNKRVAPIAIHHKLLLGLAAPEGSDEQSKMSKSKPDSAIWVTEKPEEIIRKLKKAYCPLPTPDQSLEEIKSIQQTNPILNWCQFMIYPAGKSVEIKRKPEWGGDIIYSNYSQIEADYYSGKLHPADLKNGVAECLIQWFEPIREYIKANPIGLEFLLSIKK